MIIRTSEHGYAHNEGVHVYMVVFSDKSNPKSQIKKLADTAQQMYDKFGLWPTVMACGKDAPAHIRAMPGRYEDLAQGDWTAPNKQVHLGIPRVDIDSGKKHDSTLPSWLASPASASEDASEEVGGGGEVTVDTPEENASDAQAELANTLAELQSLFGG